ncbi:kinase-like protein [Nemania abortiva]|nr:kinase-like protein [Nemania abortiva]
MRLLLPRADVSVRLAAQIAPEREEKCHCQKDTCTGKRIIFASLLRVGREDYIQCIIDRRSATFCDSTQPLKFDTLSEVQYNARGLTGKEWQLLENAQWQIRAHYLSGLSVNAEEPAKLDDGAVLPLTEICSIITDQTNMSRDISRVTIHPDHHQLARDSNIFVLKTFRNPRYRDLAEYDFKAELQGNQRAPRHDRIVPLLTAFEFGNGFHLIFPYAAEGDLHSLWKKYDVLNRSPDTHWYSPQWLLTECLGIAEALAATHQPSSEDSGRVPQLHADIKPRNILCFRNDQNEFSLKLSDFGSSRKVRPDLTLEVSGDNVAYIYTYRPPEYDTEECISLKYDVWCLACLYLEFITWAVAGYDAIDRFSQSRLGEKNDRLALARKGEDLEDTFFKKAARPPRWYDLSSLRVGAWSQRIEKVTKKVTRSRRSFNVSRGEIKVSCRIKDSVKDHISGLLTSGLCIPEIKDFLEIVEIQMLVVEMEQRASSDVVTTLLRGIKSKHQYR